MLAPIGPMRLFESAIVCQLGYRWCDKPSEGRYAGGKVARR
jgi:hypothetical protein